MGARSSAPAFLALAAGRLLAWTLIAAGVLAGAAGADAKTTGADSIRYAVRITDVNRVGLTTSNYGFFGNNFNSRSPSFEFPLGSGLEHMSRAGLWVGAVAFGETERFTGVSTAIIDNSQGTNALAETEFTPASDAIRERSRILNDSFYSPDAISDQDLDGEYSDRPARGPAGPQGERHRPLSVLVRQRMLGFSLPAAEDFVVAQFTIVNQGPPLQDVYVGLYAQLVSGNKQAYSGWPPSTTSGPGSWYYKTYVDYDSTRRLYREHYCAMLPFPDACNFPYCPPWAAVQLLAVRPDTIASKTVSLNWWSYSPGDTARDTDAERYVVLNNGARMDPRGCIPGGQCSPIMVLSVGPFAVLNLGDSVTVDYAFVGGDDEQELLDSADFAQFASDIGYRLPAPPPSPRVHVETGHGRVDFYWNDSPETAEDPTSPAPGQRDFEGYRLYLGLDRQRPNRIAQFDLVDTTGFNTGLDAVRLATPRVVDGVTYRYHYAVTGLRDGFSYYGAVTSYDTGDDQVASLESGLGQNKFQAVPSPAPGERAGVQVFPNPYRVEARWDQGSLVRDHYLWFANLPGRAVLRIYTVAGDQIFETRFNGSSYRGEGARGLYDPRQDLDTAAPRLSGASFAWDLISDHGQAVATGLYLYAVEDLDSGSVTRGKFLVVKSDREN
ncbi:MAG TPA: hypothetical protein VEY91_02000 [Candidatus Limnocylindria bacterium]|nr:hypothetical protein [Candidatus Limnocylindria bacterium]